MITVSLYKDLSQIYYGFRVSGHAGFAKKGSDIVCAAVSILVINAINAIQSLTDEKMDAAEDEKQGVIECFFPERKNGVVNKDADLLLKSLFLGFASLAEEYSDYIKVVEEAPND